MGAHLLDITGVKMTLLLDFPTIGEPQYTQALPVTLIREKQVKFCVLQLQSSLPLGTRNDEP